MQRLANLAKLSGCSAHADQDDMVNWVFQERVGQQVMSAPVVFIQHGEDRQRQGLADALLTEAFERGQSLQVVLPTPCDSEVWHDLEA